MYVRYLRRELAGRKKQTIVVAAGLAVAIALVIVTGALSAGVTQAQEKALESVYGVGTDLTVTGAAAEPGAGGGERFDFGSGEGSTDEDGTTQVSQSRLTTQMGRSTLAADAVATAEGTDGVSAASGALALTNMTFDGELPGAPTGQDGQDGQEVPSAPEGGGGQAGQGGGFGGGSFGLDQTSVLGVDGSAAAAGPL
ncbi:MAG: ABC transporter permease, partial [Microbacterium sp.]